MPPSPSIPPDVVDASAAPPATEPPSGRVVSVVVEAAEVGTTGRLIKNGFSAIFGC